MLKRLRNRLLDALAAWVMREVDWWMMCAASDAPVGSLIDWIVSDTWEAA